MRAIRITLTFCILAWLVNHAHAQGGMMPGPGTPHSAAAGFTGPGDIVSGAYAWYSCSRGYNTADTANACNVCLPGDTVCADLTLSSGFAVVPVGLATCNITTVICTVKTAYDKTGNSRDVTNATEANRPTFRPAMASNGCPTTSLPCMLFAGASSQKLQTASTFTVSQPITASTVFNRTSGFNGEMFEFEGGPGLFVNGTNTIVPFTNGSSYSVTVTDSAWHAAQAVFPNDASANAAAAYVDGVTTTGTVNTAGVSNGHIGISIVNFSSFFTGYVAEAGLWPSAFNATQAGNMNTNQHGSNGYNF